MSTTRLSIRDSLCAAVITAGLGLGLVLAPAARAQTATNKDFQLDRYQPTPAGEWTFAVEHPWYSSTRFFAAGLTLDYNHNPLVFLRRDSADVETARDVVIGNQLVGHLDLAGSFLDRIGITASVPMTIVESGTASAPAMVGPVSGVAVGDPRVGVRVRLFGQPDHDKVSMHVGLQLWIPIRGIKSADDHAGDTGPRVLPKVILAGLDEKLHLRWSASAGILLRSDGTLATVSLPTSYGSVGHEFQLGAAIGWSGPNKRFNLGPEFTLGMLLANPLHREGTSLEALFGLSYNVVDIFQIGGALGVGFWGIQGTPDFRALLRIAYAPIRHEAPPVKKVVDTDGDGIPDELDACPLAKGVPSVDPKLNGCPPAPPDEDHDGVMDALDICPTVPKGDHPDPTRPGCPAVDTDGDGFFDFEDQCPVVPAGARPDPKRPGCPAIDSDGDGVMDFEDQCPTVPAGLHPDAKKPGCPEPDRDGDNVPDSVDACPDKPGAPDPDPKKNGCPGLVKVQNGVIMILEPVFFATNKDVILPKSFPVLKAVARALTATPEIKLLAVEGHTDNQGKREKNMDLSDRRSKSVVRFLVKEGIAEFRLASQGFGPDRPIASNKTSKGRAENRRVEFRIVDPSPPASPATPAPTR